MKNFKLLLFGFSTLLFCMLTLQNQAQYTVGIKGGMNMSDLTGSSVKNNSSLTGFNFGGYFNYSMEDAISGNFGKMLSFQTELYIETKGALTDYRFNNFDDTLVVPDIEQKFTYVTIPIIAQLAFGNKYKFYIEAGGYLGSLFGTTIDGEVARDHDKLATTDERKWREEYTGFDYGFLGGAGVIVPFNENMGVMLNGRYCIGIPNIGEYLPTSRMYEEDLEEIKTTTLSVDAGVFYKF